MAGASSTMLHRITALQGQHLPPQRVICLTEETTEVLYAIGAADSIVGISGFTMRPPHARKEKPKVSTYLDARFDEILDLKPEIVFAWSDLQADICSRLIKENIAVYCFNQRSVEEICSMIWQIGTLMGKAKETGKYLNGIIEGLTKAAHKGHERRRKPRVYFEEWYDPLIAGSRWISELMELCGGVDICRHRSVFADAKRRIIPDGDEVLSLSPEIMIASWCGKMFKPERVEAREGWDVLPAIRNGELHEIHSAIILQPGPAALTDGVQILNTIFDAWEQKNA